MDAQTGRHEKVHRLSRKGVPEQPCDRQVTKARGSTLGWEQPNDIVSALQKCSEWSPIDTEKPAATLARYSEQNLGLIKCNINLTF